MSANALDIFTALAGAREDAIVDSAFRPERRSRIRTRLRWRVLLWSHETEAIETVTENLSSSGFYCFCRKPLTPGESIISVLLLPSHNPGGEDRPLSLECKVTIMRAAPTLDGLFGIACRIEDYSLITGPISIR